MRWGSAPIFTNSSMSGTKISNGIDLQQDWIYAIQANWSGSSIGTFKLQISCDNVNPKPSGFTDPATNVVNWSDYTGSFSSATAQAGSSNFTWNVLYPGYRWVRLVYTGSSGSGIMSANIFSKGN